MIAAPQSTQIGNDETNQSLVPPAPTSGCQSRVRFRARVESARQAASTSEVYGDRSSIRSTKTYWGNENPTGPRGVYDDATRFAEALTFAHQRMRSADFGVARIFNTMDPGCAQRRCPDISLARQQLGWQPRVPYKQGLADTVEWLRGQLQDRRPASGAQQRN